MFDIVIPLGPNEKSVIHKQIEYTKKNVIGYCNIYIVSCCPDILIDGCITIPETIFPFTIKDVELIHQTSGRNGWYLQQLLKLYSGICIPNILNRYLVIDSDTFFIKPTIFIDAQNKCLYNYGTEYHTPYFDHMKRLHSSFEKMENNKSGICHHMIFETQYIKEIFDMVEELHNGPFWQVFLHKVDKYHIPFSGASEYEIYFNYMLKVHADKIIIRKLEWNNCVSNIDTIDSITNVDYISHHHYMRN